MPARPVAPVLVGLALLGAALIPAPAAASGTAPADEPSATSAPASAPSLALARDVIVAGESTVASGRAEPGATVELHGYTRSDVEYALLDTAVADETGAFTFTVAPLRQSRYYVREAGAEPEQSSWSVLLRVQWAVTFDVERTSGDSFVFTGSVLPATTGHNVVVLFERDGEGKAVALARTSRGRYRAVLTDAEDAGAWTAAAVVRHSFDNLPGRSEERRVIVVPSRANPEHTPAPQ